MARTLVPVLRAAGLVALALVLAHELAFLVRYGSIYGEALVHAGHGEAWSDAVRGVIGGSVVALVAAVLGLRRLGLRVEGRSVQATDAPSRPAFVGRWLRASAGLFPTVLVLLTVQENLEHVSAGVRAPGPLILLDGEYSWAVAIVAAVSLAVAFVGALLSWRRDVLIARLRALEVRPRLRPRRIAAPAAPPFVTRRSALANRLGRRAPPSLQPA